MSLRHLSVVAGAGDPSDALALRIDVVAAAVKFVHTIDKQIRGKPAAAEQIRLQNDVELATDALYRRTKRYMAACKQRARDR